MPDEFMRLFAVAGERADAVSLAGAAAARQVGTRRHRVRVVTLLTVCALVVAAIPIGVSQLGGRRGAAPWPPATSPSAPPSAAPSGGPSQPAPSREPCSSAPVQCQTPPPHPCSLTPAQCYPPARYWYDERLPAPCTQPAHPSDALIVKRDSQERIAAYDLDQPSATKYLVTLTRYRTGGAAQYLAEVRSALSRCTTVTRNSEFTTQKTTLTYRRVGTGTLGGDESLLASRSYKYVVDQDPPTYPVYLIAIVRIGDVVAVVYDYGWEGSPSPRNRFDAFVEEAMAELRAGKP